MHDRPGVDRSTRVLSWRETDQGVLLLLLLIVIVILDQSGV